MTSIAAEKTVESAKSLRAAFLEDSQSIAFLPLLYFVWQDGVLDASQREILLRAIDQSPWLRPKARDRVEAWLDLNTPPSEREVETLRVKLASAGKNLDTQASGNWIAWTLNQIQNGKDQTWTDKERSMWESTLRQMHTNSQSFDGLVLERTAPVQKNFEQESLDIQSLAQTLHRQHPEVRSQILNFLDDPEKRAYGLPLEEYRGLVRGWLSELAKARVGALAFPGETSDEEDLRAFMVAFETLGFGDLSVLVKAGVQWGLFGGSVFLLGTEKHRSMLEDIASLKTQGCFAMSEVGHGSNVAHLETTAIYDAKTKEIVLNTPREAARKDWIGGAAHDARWATVFAQLQVSNREQGVHAFLVRIRDDEGNLLPGVRAEDCGLKMGLNGVDNGRLWFENVRVPLSQMLDRFGRIDENGSYQTEIENPNRRFFSMLGTLVGGRICVGSAGVSVAKSALAIAIRYAISRRQFGPNEGSEIPLLTYPSHQRRLMPNLASAYVYHFAFERLRNEYAETMNAAQSKSMEGNTIDTRLLEAQAAGLKAHASWFATETVQQCRESCGGQGYLAVNRFADLKADSDVFATFEGDNTVLMQLVSKSLMSKFQKRFADGSIGGFLRMVSDLAETAILKKPGLHSSEQDIESLSSPEFLRSVLEYREKKLVRSAALRMQKRLKNGMPANDALLEVQEHMLAAAHAYVDRLSIDWYFDAIEALPDSPSKGTLLELGALHGLSILEKRIHFYLEDESLSPEHARAVRKAVEHLNSKTAHRSKALIAAWQIPDACLAAPIAFFDPAHPLANL